MQDMAAMVMIGRAQLSPSHSTATVPEVVAVGGESEVLVVLAAVHNTRSSVVGSSHKTSGSMGAVISAKR